MEFIELVDNIFGKFQTNYLNNLNVVYIQNVVYDFLGNRTIIPDLSDTDFFITIEEWELLKKKYLCLLKYSLFLMTNVLIQ